MIITGRRTTDPVVRVRRVFVWSSARAQAAATARPASWSGPPAILSACNAAGGRHYPDVAAVQARLAAIAKQRRSPVRCAPRSG